MGMDLRELDPIRLKRIPEKDVSPRDIRWLSQIDVERAVLEDRWGAPEIAHDDFAEWFRFAFSPAAEEAFILLRQVDHPPVPGFVLSVTAGLFSSEAAERIVEVLGIPGARVTHLNDEAARWHPVRTATPAHQHVNDRGEQRSSAVSCVPPLRGRTLDGASAQLSPGTSMS
ncbi:hypothetical protein EES42_24250 [Streptomyces sp. ADI95-17]|nr:hypothetical protein EES42_24250 [Streptomyces sp. ADI95-17]